MHSANSNTQLHFVFNNLIGTILFPPLCLPQDASQKPTERWLLADISAAKHGLATKLRKCLSTDSVLFPLGKTTKSWQKICPHSPAASEEKRESSEKGGKGTICAHFDASLGNHDSLGTLYIH